jgi:single-strand DNA-binding protein
MPRSLSARFPAASIALLNPVRSPSQSYVGNSTLEGTEGFGPLIGYLGQDPEMRHLPTSGQPVAHFSVATDEVFKARDGTRQERVDWHNIGKAAESCKEYLKKGRQVYVEGRLRTREFEAKNNGGKRQRTEIIANRVQFLGTPPADAKSAEVTAETDAEGIPF